MPLLLDVRDDGWPTGKGEGRPCMVKFLLLMVVWCIVPAVAEAHEDATDKPALTVTGHGQMSLAPDTAYVTLGMETTGRTVPDAQRQNRLVMSKVIERLRALQIDDERIQTASL